MAPGPGGQTCLHQIPTLDQLDQRRQCLEIAEVTLSEHFPQAALAVEQTQQCELGRAHADAGRGRALAELVDASLIAQPGPQRDRLVFAPCRLEQQPVGGRLHCPHARRRPQIGDDLSVLEIQDSIYGVRGRQSTTLGVRDGATSAPDPAITLFVADGDHGILACHLDGLNQIGDGYVVECARKMCSGQITSVRPLVDQRLGQLLIEGKQRRAPE
jgi:hypothetical protein